MALGLLMAVAGCGGDSGAESADGGPSSTIDLSADSGGEDGSGDPSNATADDQPVEPTEGSEVPDGDSGLDAAPPVLVSATAFGEAELCMTRDDLEAALPDLVVGPEEQGALVDTEGVTVTDAEGNVQFYAMFLSGEGPGFQLFLTDNNRYRTDAGVGPGTELAVAASVYGPATLSYNVEAESREYASFVAGPTDIGFRTGSGPEAGVYATEEGFNETDEYDPSATIRSLEIYATDC